MPCRFVQLVVLFSMYSSFGHSLLDWFWRTSLIANMRTQMWQRQHTTNWRIDLQSYLKWVFSVWQSILVISASQFPYSHWYWRVSLHILFDKLANRSRQVTGECCRNNEARNFFFFSSEYGHTARCAHKILFEMHGCHCISSFFWWFIIPVDWLLLHAHFHVIRYA